MAHGTETSGAVLLGTLGGSESRAYALSPDGQIVVGSATLPNGRARAFR